MKYFRLISVLLLLALVAACGGGGGTAGGNSSTSATTTVAGVAMKGPFKEGGVVKVYPIINGVKGSTPLSVGSIDANSAYTVNIGDYSGSVVVEVSGEYIDEVTNEIKKVLDTAPLHAVIPNVISGKSFTVQVTPLTELAYRQAGTLTSENIAAANNLISSIMRVDIIKTEPVATSSDKFVLASESQQNYALILAAVAQHMLSNKYDLETTLAELNSGISTTKTATALNTALGECIKKLYFNANNPDHITEVPSSLQNIGTVSKLLTVSLVAKPGVDFSSVQALQTTLTLPAGLMLRTDKDGIPLDSVVRLTGSAASSNAKDANSVLFSSRYDALSGTVKLVFIAANGGLETGDIFTILCDSGTAPLDGSSAIVGGSTGFWDVNGAVLVFRDTTTNIEIAADLFISVQ